jgi:hypothetical protein
MATLPSSNTTINAAATALARGVDYVCIVGPVASNADGVPRIYGQATAIQTQHGYCAAVEHAARHIAETGKPVVFIGIPIATAGVVGREDTTGNTGTCVTTLAAGGNGVLQEHDGRVDVVTGGTIGTDQIVLRYSLDGWRTTRIHKLGTAGSFVLPDVGVTMSFAAGTLVAGDTIHTWHGTEPRSDATGWATAFDTLAAQQKFFRSMILVGELQNSTEAAALRDELNNYKTAVKRAVFCRAALKDRLPYATMSATTHRATGTFTITFGDDNPDTITRSAGSFVSDGFGVEDVVTIDGSSNNDGTLATALDGVAALVLTCDATETLTAEGPVSSVTIVGEASLTFGDNGGSPDTITRAGGNPGSWVDDGFRVGDSITVADTVLNDGSYTITALTDSTLSVTTGSFAEEVIGITTPTITAGQTKAAWMAALDAEYEDITGTGASGAARLDLCPGRARRTSPLTGWYYRVPVSERDSIASFQHDLHIAPWRYENGPTGDDLYDADGDLVEWDDRVDGGAGVAANFTTYRTYASDGGAYLALSLTRAGDGSRLQYTHNQAVVDLVDNTAQRASLTAIGQSLVLKGDGTITNASARVIEKRVNDALRQAIADQGLGDGPRASRCVFTLSRDDILNVDPATMTYVVQLGLNGTVHTINGEIQVR